MSNLPHPNGDTNPGDMFYPGSPTVTVTDAAGVGGSRCVEYGEDVTSAVQNRGLLALAKNDEYMQARLEAKISKPTLTAFTPSGGNGGSYTFSGVELFVGDATYTPETAEIIRSLVRVFDANLDDLLDASGNLVVVKEIQNSGDTASIVGDTGGAGGDSDGFYGSGAIVRFQTVNPVTRAVVNASYTLPDSSQVRFLHGVGQTLDTLATSGSEQLMRDMLMMTNRLSTRLDGAAFVRDGSRTMLGDIDANLNDLVNPLAIRGEASNDLSVISSQDLKFTDQFASNIDLSQTGETGFASSNKTSILGSLNSDYNVLSKLVGNRVLTSSGAITFTGGTGTITLPATMQVAIGGETFDVGGDSFVATTGALRAAVITSAGLFTERNLSAVLATDLVVAYYEWDGASSFTTAKDARWFLNGATNALCLTVGDAGADFTSLADALEVIESVSAIHDGAGVVPIQAKIFIVGSLEVAATIAFPAVELTIEGAGSEHSTISAASGFTTTTDVFTCDEGSRVTFRNLKFMWTSGTQQNAANCLFRDLGTGSVVELCEFDGSTTGFANIAAWSAAASDIYFENCLVTKVDGAVVDVNGNASQVHVKHVRIPTGNTGTLFSLETYGNSVTSCTLGSVANPQTTGIAIGEFGKVDGNSIYVAAAGTGVSIAPDNSVLSSDATGLRITGNFFKGPAAGTGYGVYSQINDATMDPNDLVQSNVFESFTAGLYINNTSVNFSGTMSVKDNMFTECSRSIHTAAGSDSQRLFIVGNEFHLKDESNADAIYLETGVKHVISYNKFYATLATNAPDTFITATAGINAGIHSISNNYFSINSSVALSGQAIILTQKEGFSIIGNQFVKSGAETFNIAISCPSCHDYKIIGNSLVAENTAVIAASSTLYSNVSGAVIADNYLLCTGTCNGILLSGHEGTVVARNTILNDSVGLIGITATSLTGCKIVDNVIQDVKITGIKIQTSSTNNTVTGNTISGLGNYSGTDPLYGVYVDGDDNDVSNNHFYGFVNGNETDVKGVYVNGDRAKVVGNKMDQSVASFGGITGDFNGIEVVGDGFMINSNHLYMSGATGVATASIRGIRAVGGEGVICGNNVYDSFSHSGTTFGISLTGAACAVTGNFAQGHNITISGTGGLCIGNVALGGSTSAGSYATSGNI